MNLATYIVDTLLEAVVNPDEFLSSYASSNAFEIRTGEHGNQYVYFKGNYVGDIHIVKTPLSVFRSYMNWLNSKHPLTYEQVRMYKPGEGFRDWLNLWNTAENWEVFQKQHGLGENMVDPDEFLTNYSRGLWTRRAVNNMGTMEQLFLYGGKPYAYDVVPHGLAKWYVDFFNYLQARDPFDPSPGFRNHNALSDNLNPVYMWMNKNAKHLLVYRRTHPVPGAWQPAQEAIDLDPGEFMQQWKQNPWRFEIESLSHDVFKKRVNIYFRGQLKGTPVFYSQEALEHYINLIQEKHKRIPFEGGSLIVWVVKGKNVPKTSMMTPVGWEEV